MKRHTNRLILLAIILATCSAGFLAFSRTPLGIAVLRSRKHFVTCEADARVLYEPGAKTQAAAVAACLPEAVALVEAEQRLPFKNTFRVYVCDSQESLNAYMGAPAGYGAAGVKVLNDIFLSPTAFASPWGDDMPSIVAHELSHLHIYQRLGHLRTLRELPAWFSEGLAVQVSGGGGAAVRDMEAVGAIISGYYFTPDRRGGYWRPKRASDYGIDTRMFYKQSELFVRYLRESRPDAFGDFLLALQLERWGSFGELFEDTFGIGVDEMWAEFVASLRARQAGTG